MINSVELAPRRCKPAEMQTVKGNANLVLIY